MKAVKLVYLLARQKGTNLVDNLVEYLVGLSVVRTVVLMADSKAVRSVEKMVLL